MASKVKMSVELRILKSSVVVQSPTEVFVRWHRGKQKADCLKREITPAEPVLEYARKGALWKMEASLLKNPDGSWQPDENKLVLYCGGAVVGTCHFDMSKYVGKTPKPEKATIVPENSTSTGTVLKGDAEQYPGAFIEFRVTVAPVDAAAAGSAAAATAATRRQSVVPSKPAASAEESKQLPVIAEASGESSAKLAEINQSSLGFS